MWREIWGMMAAAINSNPKIPNTLAISYLATTYSQSQAVAVRRLVDSSSDVLSLAQLLKSIAEAPQLITREWWIRQHPQGPQREFAGPEWDSEFGGSLSVHADPRMVNADLDELMKQAATVKRLVDKVVAHRVENYSGPLVTQEELGASTTTSFGFSSGTTSSYWQRTANCFLLTSGELWQRSVCHGWIRRQRSELNLRFPTSVSGRVPGLL